MRRNRERVNKRKTRQAFFVFRLIRAIPSSARLATSTKCEVPRATCNERVSAKFPAQDFFASPIKGKRLAVNVALCVLIKNCSRLSYLLLHSIGWVLKASARIKEKRLGRFSTLDLSEQIPSSAQLATSAKREVPRAGFFRVSDKRKTRQAFFAYGLHRNFVFAKIRFSRSFAHFFDALGISKIYTI